MKSSNNPPPIVRMINTSKIFQTANRKVAILKDINFEARRGELVVLLGPSGSGKSTFLTLLAGLQAPSEGEVWLFGRQIQQYSAKELQKIRAHQIGFVFQTFHLIDSLNGLENIQLVMRFVRKTNKDALAKAHQLLQQFDISYLARAYPKTMSQGEKQRIAIARALANEASLIIADEPTGSLSTPQGMYIIQLLQQIAKTENRCIIVASHDQRIIPYADRVFYLKDGCLSTPVFS